MQPSPQLFFETITAYQNTEALKAALELDVFTAIGEGNQTIASIAKRTQASERGTRILCDYLTVLGFLTKEGGRYSLTPDSAAFLDKKSRAYLGSATRFLVHPMHLEAFQNMADSVRRGGSVSKFNHLAPDDPLWVDFARGMAPLMHMPAEMLAQAVGASQGAKWKVLSLAAGHGTYEITVARHNPNAEVWAVDWPNVLEVARENAAAAGVSSRYHTIPGSAFEVEYGLDFDLALICNFLHHFDAATCETLLRKVHKALKPGGRAAIIEFVPNPDRVSPPRPAMFPLTMLAATPGGDAYTFAELQRMLQNAGYSNVENRPMGPTFFNLVLATR